MLGSSNDSSARSDQAGTPRRRIATVVALVTGGLLVLGGGMTVIASSDTTAPTVGLVLEADRGRVRGEVDLTVDAADDVAVTKVRYFIDGELHAERDTGAGLSGTWDTTGHPDGEYTVRAEVSDAAGNTESSTMTVTVEQELRPEPTLRFVLPADESAVSGLSSLAVEATDDGGVTKVQYFVDDELLGATTNPEAGYAQPWDTTTVVDGGYEVRAEAFDADGNKGTVTQPFVVRNAADIPKAVHEPKPGDRVFHVALDGRDGPEVPGTEEAPFRTLRHAASRADRPGDTIWVRGGRYLVEGERVALGHLRGTAESPIVISSYPGETATIDGSQFTLGVGNSLFGLFESSHVIVQNLEVVNSNGVGMFAGGDHLTFRNNHVHNTAKTLLQGAGDNITFAWNDVHSGSMANYMNGAETNAGGLGVTNNQRRRSTNVRFLNNIIHEVWGECLNVGHTTTAEVRGNRIYNCHGVGIYLDNANDVTIENNYIYRTSDAWGYNKTPDHPQGQAKGILLGAEYYDFMLPGTSGRPIDDVVIRNNIVTGYMAALSWWPDERLQQSCPTCSHTYSNVQVHNNVFTDNENSLWIYAAPAGEPRPTGVAATNNIFDGAVEILGGDRAAWNLSNNEVGQAGAQAAQAATTGAVDPQFVGGDDVHDPARYKLDAGSPLIGRGTALAGVTTDFWGNGRSNPPTIGAHEP